MTPPTKSQQIREYILKHPGCTTSEAAAALGFPAASVATVLSVELDRRRDKQPFYPMVLTRVEGGRTLSNVPYYRWSYVNVLDFPKLAPTPANRTRANHKPSTIVPPKQETVPPSAPPLEVGASPIQSAIDALVGSIVAAIKPQLQSAIAAAIQSTAAPQQISYTQPETLMLPAPQPATRLPRVVITGLLPYQAGQIATEFGGALEVSCWDGGSHDKLASMAKQADAVFNHTKHGGHATESTLKTVGANLIRVSGGMTSMRAALRTFIQQGQKTSPHAT